MIVWILVGLVLGILLWVVFVPVTVVIDTDLSKYEIAQWGTIRVSFHPDRVRKISITVLGFTVQPRRNEAAKRTEKLEKRKSKKGSSRSSKSLSAWWYLVRGIHR